MNWIELAVEVAPSLADEAADILRPFGEGGVAIIPRTRYLPEQDRYEPDPEAPCLLCLYLPTLPGWEVRLRLLEERLRSLAGEGVSFSQTELREEDWAESWKVHYQPVRVGRILVKPTWRELAPEAGTITIEMDPGSAFGTGQHATTRLCLQALQQHLRGGERVLDLGTGSGILAIAAAKLGARRVLALDLDAQAVEAARENAYRNGVEGQVQTDLGTVEESRPPEGAPFDLVVANLSRAALTRRAEAIQDAVRSGSTLILSGFLDSDLDTIRSCFTQATELEVLAEEDWRAWVSRRES